MGEDVEIEEPEVVSEEVPEIEPEAEPEPKPKVEVVENTEDNKEDIADDNSMGNITEDVVLEYLKEHYKAHSANIISPHDIAKNMMKSQGVQEAQFQFHLNILGKVTYWIVNGMSNALGDVVEVPGEGFKL